MFLLAVISTGAIEGDFVKFHVIPMSPSSYCFLLINIHLYSFFPPQIFFSLIRIDFILKHLIYIKKTLLKTLFNTLKDCLLFLHLIQPLVYRGTHFWQSLSSTG